MKHRILSRQTAVMLSAVAVGLAACSGHNGSPESSRGTSPRLEMTFAEGQATWTGTWQAWHAREFLEQPGRVHWIQLSFKSVEGRSRSECSFSEQGSAFQTLTESPVTAAGQVGSSPAVQLALNRPAGELVLRGSRSGADGNGTFELRPNEEYAAGLARLCGRRPNRDETLRLFMSRMTPGDFERIGAAGYRLSVEDCLRLVAFGVDAAYATAMRPAFDTLSVESLVRLRQFGVPPEFAVALRECGARFDPDALVRLRQFGVPADMVCDLRRAGFELSVDEIVRLRQFGVPAEFAAAVKQAGIGAGPDQIIRLRQFGVPTTYLEELTRAGGGFNTDEIVRLRQFGVPSAFIAEGREAGYTFTADEWIQLRNHGVSADYLTALAMPGKPPLPARSIIELRQRGVSPETIRSLRRE